MLSVLVAGFPRGIQRVGRAARVREGLDYGRNVNLPIKLTCGK